MEDNKFTEFIKKHRGEVEKIKAKNTAISDEEMAKVTGGVGGANEATCPQCGTTMNVVNANGEYGDRTWVCPSCNTYQCMSDAEYIELLKLLEAAGSTQGMVYPVWWNQIPK